MRNDHAVGVLAIKLLLAPFFVVAATLIARRFGARVGGLIAGLPVVGGPILLVYSLQHGRGFAANASTNTLLGLVSLIAFVVVYGRVSPRLPWFASLLAGWSAFAASTAIFSAVSVPAGAALAISAAALLAGLGLVPRPRGEGREHPPPPSWDLPVRAACALVLVLSLTAISGWLGPQLSGLLAPFPIIATVLAAFTHTQRGTDELMRLFRGLIGGYGAYALFCFTLAVTLRHMSTGAAFALATGVALLTQGAALALARERQGSGAATATLAERST